MAAVEEFGEHHAERHGGFRRAPRDGPMANAVDVTVKPVARPLNSAWCSGCSTPSMPVLGTTHASAQELNTSASMASSSL